MKLKINSVYVDQNSVDPVLCFDSDIESAYNIEFLYIITGELLCGNKTICYLIPLLSNNSELTLANITNNDVSNHYREKRFNNLNVKLIAELNTNKIDFLEKERLKASNRSLSLTVKLKVGSVNLATIEQTHFSYKLKFEELFDTHKIVQNDWLEKFSPILGIGEFYLIELVKPSFTSDYGIWSELYDILIENLNQMEEEIKKGDWQRTIEISRRFYENIKIGANKEVNQKYKTDLRIRMNELKFDDKGIENLLNGILNFFEFTSKFIHEKGKQGESKPIPIAKKEDAYFIYSLSLNITNLIFEKIKTTNA